MTDQHPSLSIQQVNLVVADMEASLAFYRRLGFRFAPVPPHWSEWAPHHATATLRNGFRLELDSIAFARQWNPGLDENARGSRSVIFIHVAERTEVDELFAQATTHGAPVQKPPQDAFWGVRYAIVEDPDGHAIGFMSPVDAARRFPPPPPPRTA